MTAQSDDIGPLYADLCALILRVRSCIPDDGDAFSEPADREYRLQLGAFEERCEQVRTLAEHLAPAGDAGRLLTAEEAYRLRHALSVSLDFFRYRAGPAEMQPPDQRLADAVPAT